jgi:activator of HSP90 ATPase
MNHAIHHEVDFDASPGAIYEVLTDASKFSQMTGDAPAEIDAQNGGVFSLFGGMVSGVNVECLPGERLVQAWRAGNWDPGVYSMVRFELTANGDGTKLTFDHTGFPDGEADHLSDGWTSNYWDGLRKVVSA